ENSRGLAIAKDGERGEALKKRRDLIQQSLQEQQSVIKEMADKETALLDGKLNQNQLSESEFNKQVTEIRQGSADEQIAIARKTLLLLQSDDFEGRKKINAKIAELEKQKTDILIEAQKKELDTLKRLQEKAFDLVISSENQRLIESQKLKNQGLLSDVEVEEERVRTSGEKLKIQLNQEQEFVQKIESQKPVSNPVKEAERQAQIREHRKKTQEITLQLLENEAKAWEVHATKIIATITRQNNARLTQIQSDVNEGKAVQEDIAIEKAKISISLLENQLELEKNQGKQIALKLQLEEARGALIDAESNKLKSDIERSNQAIENSIKSQNQDLAKQQNLIEMANKALDMRSQIIQSQKTLLDAGTSYLTGELDALAKTEQSEFKKKQLVEITAAIKLKAAIQQAKFDQESLNVEQAKQRLALEREEIANRIATAEAKLNVKKAEGALKIAAANPKTNAEDLEKLRLDVEIARDTLGLRQQEGGAIQSQKALQSQLQEREQQAAEFKRRSAITSAKSDAIEAIQNPGEKRAAQRRFQQDLLSDFGSSSMNDLTSRGLTTAAKIRQESGIGNNGLPGYIGEEDNLRNILGDEEYQRSRLKPQAELDKRFGDNAISSIPRQINSTPLVLPQLDIPKISVPASAVQGDTSSVNVAPNIVVNINANTSEGKEMGKNIEQGIKPNLTNVINEAHRLSLAFGR
ncbi:MAG: hypothetical protein ACRCT1_15520, partial [Microcoleaceae cyanobacterium]